MLKPVLDVAVPGLVILLMVVVGLGLTVEDFRRVVRQPSIVAAALIGQLLFLPLIALGLVQILNLTPAVEKGFLLVAACPAGSLANLYAYLARANVALSVTLTAVSCLIAVVTMPIVFLLGQAYLGEEAFWGVPIPALAGHLILALVLPILGGMTLRWLRPGLCQRYQRSLLTVSITGLAALIAFVIGQEAEQIIRELGSITLAVAALTGLTLVCGYCTAWASGAAAPERRSVAMVFVVRNVGIATAIAVTVLGQLEFAVFAAAYFLSQVPFLLGIVAFCHGISVASARPAGDNTVQL